MSGFQPTERGDNNAELVEATEVILICYNISGKLKHIWYRNVGATVTDVDMWR